MPLHLLGKKSWNVYNPANIARVRRDEAAAEAREQAEEQRMQEADAARRLAILRGEVPPPLEAPEPLSTSSPSSRRHDRDGSSRKRKRHGEDDTDFEMRLARERASAGAHATRELAAKQPSANPAPSAPLSLVDGRGHIALFAEPETRPRAPNEEAAREAARKEREFKDQYQMRLVNAAGRDGQGLTDGGPWYASAEGEVSSTAAAVGPGRDAWGREDPGRKARDAARLGASDPLAMMKRGARMVRELEKDRRKEREERERDLRVLEKEERREARRRERKRRKEDDGGRGGRGPTAREDHRSKGRERSPRDREQTRRDRSPDWSRHRRDRRDTPDAEDRSKARESSRRDHDDKHVDRRKSRSRSRSRERTRRRYDERERHRHRDGDNLDSDRCSHRSGRS